MARTSRTHPSTLVSVSERRNARSQQKFDGVAPALSERLLRALTEHGADAIALFDADGTTRYVSPSTERLLGYAPAELIGRSHVDLDHPDDAPRMGALIGGTLKKSGGHVVEVRCRHKDGTWRWIE